MKIAILGAGNMGCAIACGLVGSGRYRAEEIVCTARTAPTLERLRTLCPGVRTATDNADAVRGAAVVMLAVKPWLVEPLIREIRREIDPDRQSVVSVAAGVSLAQLSEWLTADRAAQPALFRAIPNTAIARAAEHDVRFRPRGRRLPHGAGDGALPRAGRGDARRRTDAGDRHDPRLVRNRLCAALRACRGRGRGGAGLSAATGDADRRRDTPRSGRAAVAAGRSPRSGDRPRDYAGAGITVRGLNEMERPDSRRP